MALAREVIQPIDPWQVGLGCEANAHHQVAGEDLGIPVGRHDPAAAVFVEFGCGDSCIEGHISTEVQLFIDVSEVFSYFLPRRIQFGVVPALPKILIRILIYGSEGVHSGSWVAVPVPDATELRSRFHDAYGEPSGAQTLELVQPGEAGSTTRTSMYGSASLPTPRFESVTTTAILPDKLEAGLI